MDIGMKIVNYGHDENRQIEQIILIGHWRAAVILNVHASVRIEVAVNETSFYIIHNIL
jgi:hypothetical protein